MHHSRAWQVSAWEWVQPVHGQSWPGTCQQPLGCSSGLGFGGPRVWQGQSSAWETWSWRGEWQGEVLIVEGLCNVGNFRMDEQHVHFSWEAMLPGLSAP